MIVAGLKPQGLTETAQINRNHHPIETSTQGSLSTQNEGMPALPDLI